MNNCYLCNEKDCSLYYFKIMNYICHDCLEKSLQIDKCEIKTDLENCDKIFDNYQWLNEIKGEGAFGCIYNVFNRIISKNTVLKVQRYIEKNKSDNKNSNNEIEISCLVSELPNFVKLLNYWICDITAVDVIWKSSKCAEKILHSMNDEEYDREKGVWKLLPGRSNKIFYLEMEKYDGTFRDFIYKDTKLTKHDKFSMIFELIYFLMNAYKQLGFHHRDIHPGNIFYKFNNTPREYTLSIEGNNNKKRKQSIIKCNSIFFPFWGDFGKSTIENKDPENIHYKIQGLMQDLEIFKEDQIVNEIKTDEITLKWFGEKVMNSSINKKQKIKDDNEMDV